MPRSGSCLCGAVKFSAEPMPSLQACHCHMCRKWSGGPFMAVVCKDGSFEGPVATYASSGHADRGFCSTCGTHLFFHAKAAGIHAVPIGLLDDQSGLPFRAEIYVDSQPDYYAFANDTKRLTGAEFRKAFG
jgi:hypothetical protein